MVTEKAQAEAELRQYMPSIHCLFKQRSINKKRKKKSLTLTALKNKTILLKTEMNYTF